MAREHLAHIKAGTAHRVIANRLLRRKVARYAEVLAKHRERGGVFADAVDELYGRVRADD